MSTSADRASTDTGTTSRAGTPIYKRRRRRIYGATGVVVVLVIALTVWAVTQGGSSGPAALPSFTVSVGQGSIATADGIIFSQPSLEKTIPAHLHMVPFDAGVTAIAEMRGGSVQSISGVGNPPVTAAIGNGTAVTIVFAQGFDADGLVVPKSITSVSQLAGKTVGVLVGSSEDYELEGYLALEHLTGKVKVVSFPSETAAGAAALSGAVFAAYVEGVPAADLIQQKGYHQLVNAEQIAKLGVPGIDAIAVATSVVNSDPTLVQAYVCAEVQATNDMTGPQADKYLTEAAGVQGVPANLVVTATKAYSPEIIPVDQQLYWLGSTLHDPTSRLVKAYGLTAKFLIGQGRLTTVPSAAQIASHVNISFVQKALAGGCPS
jgi:taurine transport system substrate-binding protein